MNFYGRNEGKTSVFGKKIAVGRYGWEVREYQKVHVKMEARRIAKVRYVWADEGAAMRSVFSHSVVRKQFFALYSFYLLFFTKCSEF